MVTVSPINNQNVSKMSSAPYIRCKYSNGLQTNFSMDANTMSPDQTAPKEQSWVHIVYKIG